MTATSRTKKWVGVVLVLHVLALVTFFTVPFGFDNPRNIYAELFDVEFGAFAILFGLVGLLACLLIMLRSRWPEASTQAVAWRLIAAAVCVLLLAWAAAVVSVIPSARRLFTIFGADLPEPTLLLFSAYEAWFLLPALALAATALLFSGRLQGLATGSLPALLLIGNAALYGTLLALFLPFFKMCGSPEMESGFSRLHAAAALGLEQSVRRHLDRGTSANLIDLHGGTPLLVATEGGQVAAVKVLLEAGANPNLSYPQGATALHGAAFRGEAEIAVLLLSKGADPNAEDKKGHRPLDRAVQAKQGEIATLLRERGAQPSTVESRARRVELSKEQKTAAVARSSSCGA
jgi:hypothetical protein